MSATMATQHHPATMATPPPETKRSSAIRKLVGRLRSSSVKPLPGEPSSGANALRGRRDAAACPNGGPRPRHVSLSLAAAIRTPRSYPSSPALPSCGLDYTARSLQLWNEAYDALRDDPACTGLVVAYETIVSQELPSSFKAAGGIYSSSSSRGWSDEERLGLLAVVASSGLQRRRASKVSLADVAACRLLESARSAVEAVLPEYPAAAVAWSGLCTLTPLLLDPIMHHPDMRAGIVHVVGRIRWYMTLAHLLVPASWAHPSAYMQHQAATHAALRRLYRAVLELEMNCVCAAASIWNMAAKNVIGWASLGELVQAIWEADTRVAAMADSHCTVVVKQLLRELKTDLDLGGGEVVGAVPQPARTKSSADVLAVSVEP